MYSIVMDSIKMLHCHMMGDYIQTIKIIFVHNVGPQKHMGLVVEKHNIQ